MRRTETPKPIWIKFCLVVDITDVVTHTNFGDHRLRGFWGAGGSNSPLFHWLLSSSIQHSRTTERACDIKRKKWHPHGVKTGGHSLIRAPHSGKWKPSYDPRTPQDRRHWSYRIICMYLLLTFKLFYSYVVHCPLCLKDHSLRRTNSAVISCRKEEERE